VTSLQLRACCAVLCGALTCAHIAVVLCAYRISLVFRCVTLVALLLHRASFTARLSH